MTTDQRIAADPNVLDALQTARTAMAQLDRATQQALATLTVALVEQTREAETWHANYLVENELRLTAEAEVEELRKGHR